MNQKTNVLFACAALVAGSLSLHAQSAPPGPPESAPSSVSVTVTPAFVSQYMFRGMKLGGTCFQPTVEFGAGSLAFGIWSSFPVGDRIAGVSDPEIDPYASYTIAVSDKLSVVPGVTWYNYPDADKSAGFYKSTFEPSLAANYTVGGVTLTPKFYYDLILHGPTYEFSAAFSVPLKEAGTELAFSATLGTYKWTDSIENALKPVKNWGDYWQAGVTMPFAISESSKFSLGLAYQQGSNNWFKEGTLPRVKNLSAVGRAVVTVSYSVKF